MLGPKLRMKKKMRVPPPGVSAFFVRMQLGLVFSQHGTNRPLKQSFNDYEINQADVLIIIVLFVTVCACLFLHLQVLNLINNCINKLWHF